MPKVRRSLLAAAAAAATLSAGIIAAAPSAGAAPAAGSCYPKTDYEVLNYGGAGWWHNWCGTGVRYPGTVFEVRDASYPYHRVWVHDWYGRAWCAWGPGDRRVPWAMAVYPKNVLISSNTSPC